jgi:hypothetical protein
MLGVARAILGPEKDTGIAITVWSGDMEGNLRVFKWSLLVLALVIGVAGPFILQAMG